MSAFTFFYPVLDSLSDGRIIRKSIALALRILGVLYALAGLVGVILILKQGFSSSSPTELTLGAILLSLLVLAGAACLMQICFYRGGKIGELTDSPFTVIPIVSLLFRWLGEVYATILVTLGVGGCIFMWISNTNPLAILGSLGQLTPSFTTEVTSSFLAGLLWLIYMLVAAFLVLVLAYFLAEGSLVLVDIAQNIRLLAGGNPPAETGKAATTAASASGPAVPVPAAGAVLLCRTCGAPLEAGTTFCGNCGSHA